MAMSAAAWREALAALLPPGAAWARDPDSNLQRLLAGWAEGFARFEARAEQLLEEMDPSTAYELLPDYERALALPDACTGELLALDARRAEVLAHMIGQGDQRPVYYVQLAEALGYAGAWIEEFETAHCESDCDAFLNPDPWPNIFVLHLSADSGELGAHAQSYCDDFLGEVMQSAIECLISRIKPAHTMVQFSYGV